MRYLIAALPLLALALFGLLMSEPGGPVQLAVTALCALALRPVAPRPAPAAVIELDDAGLLFHLIVNCEVTR